MKVTLNKLSAKFQPFELVIQVNTKADLQKLWHRFNLSSMAFATGGVKLSNRHPCPATDSGELALWELLDDRLKQAGD